MIRHEKRLMKSGRAKYSVLASCEAHAECYCNRWRVSHSPRMVARKPATDIETDTQTDTDIRLMDACRMPANVSEFQSGSNAAARWYER